MRLTAPMALGYRVFARLNAVFAHLAIQGIATEAQMRSGIGDIPGMAIQFAK